MSKAGKNAQCRRLSRERTSPSCCSTISGAYFVVHTLESEISRCLSVVQNHHPRWRCSLPRLAMTVESIEIFVNPQLLLEHQFFLSSLCSSWWWQCTDVVRSSHVRCSSLKHSIPFSHLVSQSIGTTARLEKLSESNNVLFCITRRLLLFSMMHHHLACSWPSTTNLDVVISHLVVVLGLEDVAFGKDP